VIDEPTRRLDEGALRALVPRVLAGLVRRGEVLAVQRPGRYQVEAAIAALHDDAASAEETDWPQILAWYDDLVALTDDPVRQDPAALLGRAVAVGHVLGAAAGLRETDRLREVLGERHR
jgi:predicted RNA polymerase sigma factor